MTFTYTRDRPNPPNNPSSDVPDMLQNTNSIDDLISVDHFSFNVSEGGKHKQVQLRSGAAIPAGLTAGEGTLYTKTLSGASQLFYTRDASATEIQLTSTGIVPQVIVPTFTPAAGASATYLTFLPGNTVLISGQVQNCGSSQTITFGFNISGIFSVQLTRFLVAGPSNRSFHQVTGLAANGFTFRNLDDGGSATAGFGVMWTLFGVL